MAGDGGRDGRHAMPAVGEGSSGGGAVAKGSGADELLRLTPTSKNLHG